MRAEDFFLFLCRMPIKEDGIWEEDQQLTLFFATHVEGLCRLLVSRRNGDTTGYWQTDLSAFKKGLCPHYLAANLYVNMFKFCGLMDEEERQACWKN